MRDFRVPFPGLGFVFGFDTMGSELATVEDLQLDLCQKMACYSKRTPARYAMRIPFFVCMDYCHISYCGSYNMGELVDCDTGTRFDWFGCYNGGNCPLVGILLNHVMVENPVAELKYAFYSPCS
ncbi:hypothetical protein SAY87_016174 [Trapa incisa]|uniref:Uncharacterized protein n=1 Tax=Trapa incisa TaxID=236973 RepID=A0AAN7LC24_9MYRT|nr:hypothetical protein SAY87_016174 [Trapa incisa]